MACCVKGGPKLKFDSELQVANRFIKNNSRFPHKDLIAKKYNFSKECLDALRMGIRDCELANEVMDSLDVFWESYKMKSKSEINEILKELISAKKDGFQVFFSDIYKNTIAAEIKTFCVPYNRQMWMGSSVSFFFIFNDKGEIDEIYSGITVHYN